MTSKKRKYFDDYSTYILWSLIDDYLNTNNRRLHRWHVFDGNSFHTHIVFPMALIIEVILLLVAQSIKFNQSNTTALDLQIFYNVVKYKPGSILIGEYQFFPMQQTITLYSTNLVLALLRWMRDWWFMVLQVYIKFRQLCFGRSHAGAYFSRVDEMRPI